MAFAETPENGVTLVTIQGAHTIDTAIALLGGFTEVSALATTQYKQVQVAGSPGRHPRSTPDHIILQARLAGGAALSLETAGGRPSEATPTLFEVTGETGVLLLEGGASRGFQSGGLRLVLNGTRQAVEAGELAGMPDAAANVAGLYAMLRDDINHKTATAPGFDHAVRLTRLVDALLDSSRTGVRASAMDWPQP